MFSYIMLHLPGTLSSGAQQPAGSAHTCRHITVTFLLSTTALIGIYLQTNTSRKVRVPASELRANPSPRWARATGMADEAQISSDISAVACCHDRPRVLNQNVSALRPGRADEVRTGRSGGSPIGVHHCSLLLEQRLPLTFHLLATCYTEMEPRCLTQRTEWPLRSTPNCKTATETETKPETPKPSNSHKLVPEARCIL